MSEIEEILKNAGVAPTPVRLLVYRSLRDASSPMSLSDIETDLESVDKSTISRTLSTFREHKLLHTFNDGSGSAKYEICTGHDHETHDDSHVHFRCEKCGQTYCLADLRVPVVKLPKGFKARELNYVITGVCNYCNRL